MTCMFCGHDPRGCENAFECCELGSLAYYPTSNDADEFTMTVGELRAIAHKLAAQKWEIERRDRKMAKVAGIARIRIAKAQTSART